MVHHPNFTDNRFPITPCDLDNKSSDKPFDSKRVEDYFYFIIKMKTIRSKSDSLRESYSIGWIYSATLKYVVSKDKIRPKFFTCSTSKRMLIETQYIPFLRNWYYENIVSITDKTMCNPIWCQCRTIPKQNFIYWPARLVKWDYKITELNFYLSMSQNSTTCCYTDDIYAASQPTALCSIPDWINFLIKVSPTTVEGMSENLDHICLRVPFWLFWY